MPTLRYSAHTGIPDHDTLITYVTKVECIEFNETRKGSRLINYLAVGYYFILFDCYCDVTDDAQIWRQN